MLSRKFVPLWLELRPSYLFHFYLIVAHSLGILSALLPAALPWYIRLSIIILVCISAVVCWRIYRYEHSSSAALKWIWRDSDRWRQMTTALYWRMLPAYFLSSYLIVVCLANEAKQKRYVLIFHDQLPAAVYHQLYVRLKFWRDTHDYSAGVM